MKGTSIVEVVTVFVLMRVLGCWRYAQFERLGASAELHRYVSGILMFVIPLAIIWLAGRDWASYGITLKNWRYNLQVGLDGYLVKLIPWIGGYGLIIYLGTSHSSAAGAVILVVAYAAATWVMLGVMARRDPTGRHGSLSNLAVIGALLLVPIVVGALAHHLTPTGVSTVLWLFVFTGFGEELLFRGYIQSTVNREFGRPWKMKGVQFGVGLVVSSLLFGASHLLNT